MVLLIFILMALATALVVMLIPFLARNSAVALAVPSLPALDALVVRKAHVKLWWCWF